jgi:hypothetical protein
VTVLGRIALVCGVIALVGSLAHMHLVAIQEAARTQRLPPPEGFAYLWGMLRLVGIVSFFAGWYFLICGYLAHGPFGPWKTGLAALVLLIAATMSSCVQL